MLFKAWDVLKCENGHPLFIATAPQEDCEGVYGITTIIRKKLVPLSNLRPGWKWTCQCGSGAFNCIPSRGLHLLYQPKEPK